MMLALLWSYLDYYKDIITCKTRRIWQIELANV